jgi:hypothetical protein
MKAHDLAALLLDGPDVPACMWNGEFGAWQPVERIECGDMVCVEQAPDGYLFGDEDDGIVAKVVTLW